MIPYKKIRIDVRGETLCIDCNKPIVIDGNILITDNKKIVRLYRTTLAENNYCGCPNKVGKLYIPDLVKAIEEDTRGTQRDIILKQAIRDIALI